MTSRSSRSLIAHKWQSKNKSFARVDYISQDSFTTIPLVEDTEMCDGIGGIIWEGSLVLCEFLRSYLGTSNMKENLAGFELGAGTGLSGMVSAMCGLPTLITDRYSDLAEKNVKSVLAHLDKHMFAPIGVKDYSWGENVHNIMNEFPEIQYANKVVYGAEIACLMKQHDLLVDSIKQLADSSPSSMFFITFDGSPIDPAPKYKTSFLQKMKAAGFASAVVFTGSIEWEVCSDEVMQDLSNKNDPFPPLPPMSSGSAVQAEIFSKGYFRDLTNCYPHDHQWLAISSEASPYCETIEKQRCTRQNTDESESIHHIIAFFKMSSLRLCSRCNRHYFMPIHSRSCQHHKGFYVCRQHPAELKLSVDGLGDSLGYYGTGEEWKAHFWDCCGIEDQQHRGCFWDYHQMYK